MNPVVEVEGRQYFFEGDTEVNIEPEAPELAIRVEDTSANRRAIDSFFNDRSHFSGVKPLTVIPDENGIVTFGVDKSPLPNGYRRETRISQVQVLIKKVK